MKRIKRKAPIPTLLVQPCECGTEGCKKFVIAMIHPLIRELEGSDQLASMVLFPAENGASLIRQIAEMCEFAGCPVGNPLDPVERQPATSTELPPEAKS